MGFSIKAKASHVMNAQHTIRSINFTQDTLTKKNVLNRIKKVAAKQFSVNIEKLNLKTDFVKDFGVDDLDMVEFDMALEEEFKIDVPDADLEKMTTMQIAYDYIVKVLKVKK